MPLSAEEEDHENKAQNELWRCIFNMIRKNVSMAPGTEVQMLNMQAQGSGADQVSQGFRDAGVLG